MWSKRSGAARPEASASPSELITNHGVRRAPPPCVRTRERRRAGLRLPLEGSADRVPGLAVGLPERAVLAPPDVGQAPHDSVDLLEILAALPLGIGASDTPRLITSALKA